MNTDDLRTQFPHGHPDFLDITLKELQLHSDKNNDYAAGGKPTGNFDRVASILILYPKLNLGDPRVVALVYALKQWDAVLWGLSEGIVHKVEGLDGRLQDISVYAKIVMCMNRDLVGAEKGATIGNGHPSRCDALAAVPQYGALRTCQCLAPVGHLGDHYFRP